MWPCPGQWWAGAPPGCSRCPNIFCHALLRGARSGLVNSKAGFNIFFAGFGLDCGNIEVCVLSRVLARKGEFIGLKGVLISFERGSGSGMCSIFDCNLNLNCFYQAKFPLSKLKNRWVPRTICVNQIIRDYDSNDVFWFFALFSVENSYFLLIKY